MPANPKDPESELKSVEQALFRFAASPTLGQAYRAVPSGWISSGCGLPGYPSQKTTFRILKKLERMGIATRLPGTMDCHGYRYSKWWHTGVIRPDRNPTS